MPKVFNWNDEKNQQLIADRGVSFEDVVYYIQQGQLLDDLHNPNQEKYPNQRIFIIEVDSYAYLVPYVENDEELFLKTIIPSRKATKQYIGEKS